MILIIQDNLTIDTVLFDHQGNAIHYEEFSLSDKEVEGNKSNEILVNHHGEIFWCFDILEKGQMEDSIIPYKRKMIDSKKYSSNQIRLIKFYYPEEKYQARVLQIVGDYLCW